MDRDDFFDASKEFFEGFIKGLSLWYNCRSFYKLGYKVYLLRKLKRPFK